MTILNFEDKRLEKLPPKELGPRLMELPIKKRLETILQRRDAELVVNALADQDFYFSIKELGAEDSLPLLAMGSVTQLNYLFDLEWWQKDQVLPAKAADWLERLSMASDKKLLEWVYQADFELLVVLFKKWIRVAVTPEDVDLVEARDSLPLRTLDDQYFWEAHYPQYEDFLYRLLSLIFEVNYSFYKELMNSVLFVLDAEVEETAYRFHRGRLEDRAVPDFFDALEIYRSIRPEEIAGNKTAVNIDVIEPPSFALALIPDDDLLSKAVEAITDKGILDTLKLELASVANKVVIADQLSPDSPEALLNAVQKTAAYINLGLSLLAHDDPPEATQIVQEVFLEHLFRLGQSQVAGLKARLVNEVHRGWFSRWPKGIKILDQEWLDRVELLLGKTPKIVREALPSGPMAEEGDFFRTKRDLGEATRIVEAILALSAVLDSLDVSPHGLETELWPSGQVRMLEDVTIGTLLRTAAAHCILEGKWEVKPIRLGDWGELFPRLSPDALEGTIRAHITKTVLKENERLLVEYYLAPLFQAYREEMGPFIGKKAPDPEMVRFFLFST